MSKIKNDNYKYDITVTKDTPTTTSINYVLKDKYKSSAKFSRVGNGLSILILILSILLFIGVIRVLGSSDPLTFSSLLDVLQHAPELNLRNIFSTIDLTISGNWLVFDQMRVFLNLCISGINVAIGVLRCCLHCLHYLEYFIQVIFV